MQNVCSDKNLPPLPALVVNTSRIPGVGFKTAYDEFYNPPAEQSLTESFEKEFKNLQAIDDSP